MRAKLLFRGAGPQAHPRSVLSPDVERALAAAMATQDGLVTRAVAYRIGLNRRTVATRLRAGVLDEPAPGVLRSAAVAPTWRQQLRLATLVGAGRGVASHRAAAALHRLDGYEPTIVEASVSRPLHLRLPGAVTHEVSRLEPGDLLAVDGIPCTGLARTLADLGSVVPPDAVERALDDARRRGINRRWLRDTAIRLHRPGQAGTGVLLALLDQADADPAVRGSWFEKLVEDCLISAELPPLFRQHWVYDERRRLVAILDLGFPRIKLGVEAHSRKFHFGRVAELRDEDRDHRLARLGWEVLYVGWQGTKRPQAVLELVIETARHRPHFVE